MNNQLPFQYAVLRYTYDIMTGEFLNVGIAVYSKVARYFKAKIITRYHRITDTFPAADGEFYRQYANHLQNELDVLREEIHSGQVSFLEDLPEDITILLRKVLIPDDSTFQFGPASAGMAPNLDEMLNYYYERLVERYAIRPRPASRSDDDVWQAFRPALLHASLLSRLGAITIRTPYDTFEFQHAAKNGVWNVLEPISFDVVNAGTISSKARTWLGSAQLLQEADESVKLYMLLGKPRSNDKLLMHAYERAIKLFDKKSQELKIEIVEEESAATFARRLKPIIESHNR